MTEELDPIEALRTQNPVDPQTLAEPRDSAYAQALFEKIILTSQTPVSTSAFAPSHLPDVPPRRKPRRIVVIPVAVMAALGLAAFAWILVPQSVTKYANVGCYAADSLNANTAIIGSGNDPISACGVLWEQGQFGPPSHPGLAACVLPSGAVGIFPTTSGDSVCSQLNLAVPEQPYPNAVSKAFNSFKSAVVSELVAAKCMSPVNARSTVRQELDTHNLSSWTVSSGTFTADRPCAGLAFNTDGHQILLVPQPPNQG